MMDWELRHKEDCALVEEWLKNYFTARKPYGDLNDAILYSLMAGGKRVRPVLLLETCRMCGGDVEAALPFAGAVEMIHTYSFHKGQCDIWHVFCKPSNWSRSMYDMLDWLYNQG